MLLESKCYSLTGETINIYKFVDKQNNLWFKTKEVAQALNYKIETSAVKNNVQDEDKVEQSGLILVNASFKET